MFSMEQIVKIKEAINMKSRESLVDWCYEQGYVNDNDLVKQFDRGIAKEIPVQLYLSENDDYNELWKEIGTNHYYVRETNYGGCWYTVSDPLGYCERDATVKSNIVFYICGPDGKRLGASSNVNAEIPTIKEVAMKEWYSVKDRVCYIAEDAEKDFANMYYDGTTTLSVNKWLLSFKDPARYEKEIKDMHGYDKNWLMHRHLIETEIISKFEHLGEQYAIYRLKFKHDVCGVEFYEFYSGRLSMGKYESYVAYYASWFDADNVGPMYTQKDAINIVAKALKEIYPSLFGTVKETYGSNVLTTFSYEQAAEQLLNRNFSRANVAEVIKKENETHTFIDVVPGIEERYEDLQTVSKLLGFAIPVKFKNGKLCQI